ncbi:E-selectin-like isoform X1 [Montipora foliosa]|uniref:E-selectin-like isoform X1 n=1 Tax=Montipora foliosa TaxID=591990 RepID=UPI0035F1D441
MAYHRCMLTFLGVILLFVLSVTSQGVCPRGWQLINGSWYEVSSTSANWTAAKSACEAMGSRLAMLKTHAEQQAVWRKVGKRVWIGLHRNPNDSSQWLWIDGSQVTDTNWYTGEPNNAGGYEGCGEMYSSSRRGTWNDQPCNDTLLYLCEAKGTCERLSLGSGVHVSPSHCLSSNQSYGSTCSFSCARGYRLSGPLSTQCMELGVWSEDVRTVSCKGTCERLSLGSGVHVSPSHCLSSNQSYGSTCSFSCAHGYRLSGPPSTQCMELEVWSEDVKTVSCKVFYRYIYSKGIWSDARELEDPEMVVLVEELKSLQKFSKASCTLSKYAASWKTWCTWSSSTLHIPEIPTKPLHVALFLTEMFLSCVEKSAGSSLLESAVYAIR